MANLGIIDTDALAEMNAKIDRVLKLATDSFLKDNQLLLTAEEAGILLSYDEKTVRRKKRDIGYWIGSSYKDLRFPMEYIVAYKERGKVPPTAIRTHKK